MPQVFESFISVGIDIASDFSEMAMVLPNQQFLEKKTFRIYHSKQDSLSAAVRKIKKAEEENNMKTRIFMESTGIYHYPLFRYLTDAELDVYVINPLITNSNKNSNIRKVKNDRVDAKSIALEGLRPELKVSKLPQELVMDFRNLCREYYYLVDEKAAFVIKLTAQIRIAFPQFKGIFSTLTAKTALAILKGYGTPKKIIEADKGALVSTIATLSRKGMAVAEKKYEKLLRAATDALTFSAGVDSNFHLIAQYIRHIEHYQAEIDYLLSKMKELVKTNEGVNFVKQVSLLETIKGVGFLSALTLMCEIGDFEAFKKPKQLFAYFGLDPSVNQSGNFNGTRMKMSKRGSRIARRVLFMVAVQSIGTTLKQVPKNPVLHRYYHDKLSSGKTKMCALGAIMHKICNIIFAVLRDERPYVLKTPEQHQIERQASEIKAA